MAILETGEMTLHAVFTCSLGFLCPFDWMSGRSPVRIEPSTPAGKPGEIKKLGQSRISAHDLGRSVKVMSLGQSFSYLHRGTWDIHLGYTDIMP